MSEAMDGLVNRLLEQEPEQVEMWLRRAWAGDIDGLERFNWLLLAEGAAFNALSGRQPNSNPPDLRWARLATAVYDRLATSAPDESSMASFQNSSMNLRAAMIARLGPAKGDPVLDPDTIERWFFQNLPTSLDDAAAKASSWKNLSLEEIRKLRRLKNRLSVIRLVRGTVQFQRNEELDAWLSVSDRLP
jgi:hypothetical protein